MFRRNQVKTHGRLAREELNQSYEHLRMAAAHAAGGAAGALAPRVDAARKAVKPGWNAARDAASTGIDSISRLSAANSRAAKSRAANFRAASSRTAKDGARQAKRLARRGTAKVTKKETSMSGPRWPMIIGGLLAAGVAVGAASALMKRRGNAPKWDEYGSTHDGQSMIDTAKSTMNAGVDKVSAVTEVAKERASDLIGSAKTSTENMGSHADMTRGDYKQQRDDVYGKPGGVASAATPSTPPRA